MDQQEQSGFLYFKYNYLAVHFLSSFLNLMCKLDSEMTTLPLVECSV